jgi:hypothetical protein
MPDDALLPGQPPRRCERCGHPVPSGPLHHGLGSACAREEGLLPPRQPRIPRPRSEPGDNQPSLLDLIEDEDNPVVRSDHTQYHSPSTAEIKKLGNPRADTEQHQGGDSSE